jgi:hypothetical protein
MSYNIKHKHMKDNLILQDKNYISAKRASIVFGYTSDYVGQLCRLGKLECKMIGRSWFVSEESVIKHREAVAMDLNSKKDVAENDIQNISLVVFDTGTFATVSLLLLEAPKSAPSLFVSPVFNSNFSPISTPIAVAQFSAPTVSVSQISNSAVLSSDTKSTTNNSFKKFAFASALFVFAFIFIFKSFVFIPDSNKSNSVASVISVTKEITSELVKAFSMIPYFASNLFDHGSIYDKQKLAEVENPPPESSQGEQFGGLAVVPSSQTVQGDELIKKKIRDSFSDEVEIKPDESGTAGVITPVFRKVKGNDFVYVMVPVKN